MDMLVQSIFIYILNVLIDFDSSWAIEFIDFIEETTVTAMRVSLTNVSHRHGFVMRGVHPDEEIFDHTDRT